MTAEFMLATFDETDGAQEALDAVRGTDRPEGHWVDEIAVVERHESGRVATHTMHGSVTEGSAWGGLTGGLIGLLFGPAGFLVGLLIGGGGGAVVEKIAKESGLPVGLLGQIRSDLPKGNSALALIGDVSDIDEMAEALEPHNPTRVVRHDLSDEIVDQLRAGAGEADEPEADG
jgi:uncharacterized membrane protein